MSKLEQFFELIGVQPNVKFKLTEADTGKYVHGAGSLYLFTPEGLLHKHHGCSFPEYVPTILSGEYVINPEPFKPEEDGDYWYFNPSGLLRSTYYSGLCTCDVLNFLIGNCFPSESVPDDKYFEIKSLFEEAGVNVSGWKR